MTDLDAVLQRAVDRGDAPFLVATVARADGTIWTGAAGEAAPGRAAEPGTALRLYSMTKAVGAVAALILIDRGRLDPEARVADILPDWHRLQVIDGWDGDSPVLRPPRAAATIRHLATHTAGLDYPTWNPDMARFLRRLDPPRDMTRLSSLTRYALTCDPGTRWSYGIATDWLGRVVEVLDGRSVDVFCRDEILGPLGMADTRFEPAALADRLAPIWQRGADGAWIASQRPLPPPSEFYGMGHALYGTAPDYLRFLRMVLGRGALDGVRILPDAAFELLVSDQMRGLAVARMVSVAPAASADVDLFPGTRITHSFGFLRTEADVPGKRAAGSLFWAGLANTHYWIDPARGVAAVLATQSLPFVERGFLRAFDAFERAVYAGL